MELLQLRYFQTVARTEHMTKAAQELHIAQPALSKTISRLEADVGVPLFDRHGGRIRLNTFGKLYLDKVERALRLLEEGQKEINDLAGLEHGSIHLATSTLDPLSEPLSRFLAEHPDVNFQISQAGTDEMMKMMELGEVDLCFTSMDMEQSEWSQATVLREDVYLAVPQGHRLAVRKSINLNELENEAFIGYKEEFIFQQMNDKFLKEAGITPRYVCRVDDPPAIASLVRAGLGVALFGCLHVQDANLKLLPIAQPECQRHYRIIWHEKRYLSLAARKFRDFVIQHFSDQS
ncbi:LysR family transcriptional regulator [Paenibacillus lautus]|uniref:LysR family transcriptional regulator n=1 Tax=Paenibacillus lautus TaxID=1401 RepID=A0A385TMT6_PAELA|nr:LysR family transcriptional regulator [Paenibacillus lautus]AYB43902.1 LysR family transcriptional regulator [Paenibacillus lautus]MBY0161486.1 LysR family transcriptional regulator [Cytobacillus firmus]